MLAPSAFLASAASTLTLQESILPSHIDSVPDHSVASTEIVWEALSSPPVPASNKQHIQKAWDKLIGKERKWTCIAPITACTVVEAGPSQWERAIFDPPQLGDPWTDFDET